MNLSSLVYLTVSFTIAVGHNVTYVISSENNRVNCLDNASRCLTLNDFIKNAVPGQSAFQSEENVIFQSGAHVVNETGDRKNITASHISNLTLRGETQNSTIICLSEFYFVFDEVNNMNITNLSFQNCTNREEYKATRNFTLLFTNLKGDVVLDSIKIISGSNESLVMFVSKGYIQLVNSVLSGNSGIFVLFNIGTDKSVVNISNCTFNTSCVGFKIIPTDRCRSNTSHPPPMYTGIITNTTFIGCSCWSLLGIQGYKYQKTEINITDVNIVESSSSFLIYAKWNTSMNFMGDINFLRNEGVAYFQSSAVTFHKAQVRFINNTLLNTLGSPIYAVSSNISFNDSQVLFKNNTGLLCGGITGKGNSEFIVMDDTTINFESNKGCDGGAMSLSTLSVLRFQPMNCSSTLEMTFSDNEARRGGAIFVQDSDYVSLLYHNLRKSALDLSIAQTETCHESIKLNFTNNRAQIGGDQIYGGWIDWHVGKNGTVKYSPCLSNFNVALNFGDDDVSSDPLRVCMCTKNLPNCNITEHSLLIYGLSFSLDLVAVGQRFGKVAAFIEASLQNKYSMGNIEAKYKVQMVQRSCSTLQYVLNSEVGKTEKLEIKPIFSQIASHLSFDTEELHADDYDLLFKTFQVTVNITDCPIGFNLTTNGTCICLQRISEELHLSCNSTTYTICRNEQQWVGVTHEHTVIPGVIAHQHCPFDYCRRDSKPLCFHVDTDNQDVLCAVNRTGILCGGCKKGFSMTVGSPRCEVCSNITLLVLVPMYLLSGLLLVILLMLLDLTVSANVATINGLVFYANIIRAQHTNFFNHGNSNSFLSLFIAWINLDQGVESCLCNSLDAVGSCWLEFLFPVYIWIIAATLIVSSRYSSIVMKLTGTNAVQVLATLFLISYARLLRLIMYVFSFTTITYPDGYKKIVWLIDGNVEFLKGKHIPLFLVTFLFVLISLPYTFVLLTIQWLYKISHYRAMSWVQRLKPFFDAYTGPYKANHRYWTGLLLTARIVLLIIFSLNWSNNPSVNLLAIIVVAFALLGWFSFANWVYRNTLNNILEVVNLSNLGIAATAVFFNLYNKNQSQVATFISTSITFVIFIICVSYHIQKRLFDTTLGSNFKTRLMKFVSSSIISRCNKKDISITGRKNNQLATRKVTSTIIEVERTSLEHSMYTACELRASLLEDDIN